MPQTRTLGSSPVQWALRDGKAGACEHCHTPVTSGQKVYKPARLIYRALLRKSVHMSCWDDYESAQLADRLADQLGLGPGMNLVVAQDIGGMTVKGLAIAIPGILDINPDKRVVLVAAVMDRMREGGSHPPYVWLLCGSRCEIYGSTPPIADWQEFDRLVSEWLRNPQTIGSLTTSVS